MKGKFYFPYFCFGHSRVVFIPLTRVKYFPPICYFLLNFLSDFFFNFSLNILLYCLRVWDESSCQRSSFDSFKCLTPLPDFCSASHSSSSVLLFNPPKSLVLFEVPNAEKRFTHLQHTSLLVHLQQHPSLHML